MRRHIAIDCGTPRPAFSTAPFVSAFADIETETAELIIGASGELEEITSPNHPEYIRLLCRLSAKSIFPKVSISAGYKITEDGEPKVMTKSLYDGSIIPMTGIVSEVSIEFWDIDPTFAQAAGSAPYDPWQHFRDTLERGKILYVKKFALQTETHRIPNFRDRASEQGSIIHTKSRAHCFGGAYHNGIKFSDIQPYLFFLGTGIQAEEYIEITSARELLQSKKVELAPEIKPDHLATLEDDICNGKVSVRLGGELYSSTAATKTTLTSDIFQMLFRKSRA